MNQMDEISYTEKTEEIKLYELEDVQVTENF